MSDFVIHPTAGMIGEADSPLSGMQSTGCAGASKARVLDDSDPLAKLAAKNEWRAANSSLNIYQI